MTFDNIAFGIYLGHDIKANIFCKIIFSNIFIEGKHFEMKEEELYNIESDDFKFKVHDDIDYSDGINEFVEGKTISSTGEIGFTRINGSVILENGFINIKTEKKITLKFLIEKGGFDKFTFVFYINGYRYEIGKAHNCGFMIYSGILSQWIIPVSNLIYDDDEIIQLVNLKQKLISQNRLDNNVNIGLIPNCECSL